VSIIDGECVGYSSTARQEFGVQDARLRKDVDAVFAQNRCVDALLKKFPGRQVITLVNLAALSSPPTDKDWSAAQSEELEGALLQQRHQNSGGDGSPCVPDHGDSAENTAPLLRIILANGGARMGHAADVVRAHLAQLASRDRTVLAVFGLDRSVPQTEQAIAALGNAGILTMATTLSADRLTNDSPLYFQLIPENKQEAELLAEYAASLHVDRARVYYPQYYEGSGPTQERVPDRYIDTLYEDLRDSLAGRRIERVDESWKDVNGAPGFTLPADQETACSDPSTDMIFYIGRHEDFQSFWNAMHDDCPPGVQPTPIVADDAVSRYVAQVADGPSWVTGDVYFVNKGSQVVTAGGDCVTGKLVPSTPLGRFCGRLSGLYKEMYSETGRPDGVRWPGGRIGLAYDAVGLLLAAVSQPPGYGGEGIRLDPYQPTIASVAQRLRDRQPYSGVTGNYTFASGRVAGGSPLAILHVTNPADPRATPVSVYSTDN
jgi:ABC-type branched-subunit amino acid transport system substrate-binding protein